MLSDDQIKWAASQLDDYIIKTAGIRFHEEFAKLGVKIEDIVGVFRSAPLDTAKLYRTASTEGTGTTTTVTPTASEDKRSICSFYVSGNCRYGRSCKRLHPIDRNDNDFQSEAGGAPLRSMSSALQNGDRSKQTAIPEWSSSLLPRKMEIPEDHIAVNQNDHRLDPYIEPIDQEALSQLRSRTTKQRLCNNFHLTGECAAGENCQYDHEPIDRTLRSALESLARSQPCPRRGGCRKVNCTHGHICQYTECKHRGGKAFCKYSIGEDVLPFCLFPSYLKSPEPRDSQPLLFRHQKIPQNIYHWIILIHRRPTTV